MENKEPSFEEIFVELEKIVRTMEAGGLTLEQSLSLFEEGMRLAKLCNNYLNSAELKINQFQQVNDNEE